MQHYWSEARHGKIGRRMIGVSAVAAFCVLSALLFYVYGLMRHNAIARYQEEMIHNTQLSGENIRHYLNSTVKATRSVYINHTLLDGLMRADSIDKLEKLETQLQEYFRSVYYTSTTANQICLAIPERGYSVRYQTQTLLLTFRKLSPEVQVPSFSGFRDVVIEPTHLQTDYGHDASISVNGPAAGYVFTLWLPIAELPASQEPKVFIAVDIPISFIMEQCRPIRDEAEEMYILNENGTVMAAGEESWIGSEIGEACPEYAALFANWGGNPSGTAQALRSGDNIYAKAQIDTGYSQWTVVKIAQAASVYALTRSPMVSVLLCILAGITLLAAVHLYLILRYTGPLKSITKYMQDVANRGTWDESGQLANYEAYRSDDELGTLYRTFQKMMDSLHEHVIRQYELRLAYVQSELRIMQAQINPHFIYNIIQCFATNALRDHDAKQYSLISSFGQMLHYCMVLEPSMVPLEREVEYVQRYLVLQDMRFEKELDKTFMIGEEAGKFLLPKMTVQPLVENAVMHGKLYGKEHGCISVQAVCNGDRLTVVIADNGCPVEEESAELVRKRLQKVEKRLSRHHYGENQEEEKFSLAAQSIRQDRQHNHFIGMENVYARLLLSFSSCQMEIAANEQGGTTVLFEVCAKPQEKQQQEVGEE